VVFSILVIYPRSFICTLKESLLKSNCANKGDFSKNAARSNGSGFKKKWLKD